MKTCSVEECDRVSESKGWCGMHYKRWLKNGDPLHKRRSKADVGCQYEGCDRPHNAKGYCNTHYNRIKRWNDPNANKKKGRHITSGYYYVRDPDRPGRAIAEHRLIMQQHIGRRLTPEENVHHKNGDRLDNRIENLEIWNRSQPSGQKPEDKIEYAVQILKQYAPHLLKETNNV